MPIETTLLVITMLGTYPSGNHVKPVIYQKPDMVACLDHKARLEALRPAGRTKTMTVECKGKQRSEDV